MTIINKARACAVSGHRAVNDLDRNTLKQRLLEIIKDGYDTFLVGMAIGFDTICFNVLEELKKEYPIKIIACVPCREQCKNFSETQRKEYIKNLNNADSIELISQNYSNTCMKKRNEFMVDNASCLVYYLRHDYGGTFHTVNYAKKNNLKLIKV